MTKQVINVGTSENSQNGDNLRNAFIKVNNNFTELYTAMGADVQIPVQTGNTGKFLTTDGSALSWTDINSIGDDVQFVSVNTATGLVSIQSGYNTGMPVYIKGGNCEEDGVGGDVIIEAGAPEVDGTTGNVEIAANNITLTSNTDAYTWTFNNDGNLELPAGGDIVDSDGNTVLGGTGGSSDRLVNGDHEFVLNVNGLGPWISFPESSGSKIEIQGTDINGLGPFGLLLQSTENDVTLSANATATNGPRRDWTFGTDGKLTTPDFWRVGNGNTNTSISNDGFANNHDLWLRAGDALFITTDLTVNGEASDSLWLFSNKVLQLPNGGDIVDSNGTSVLGGGTGGSSDRLVNGDLEAVLDSSGTINTPLLLPTTFTAVFDPAHKTGDPIVLDSTPWEVEVSFQVNPDGEVETILNAVINPSNPGYTNNDTFEFTEVDHGIPGYTIGIVLDDIANVGGPGAPWTATVLCSMPPQYPSTINSSGAIKLTSNENSWILGTDGYFNLPGGTAYITAELGAVTIQADGAPGSSGITLTASGSNVVSQADLTLSTAGGAYNWNFGTDGTITLQTQSPIIFAEDVIPTPRIYRATTSNDATAIINAKTDWIGSETQWEDARNNDAITYPSRPWAGLPSWEAYPLVLAYNGPDEPSGPFAQIVTAARNHYLTFKNLESNIDIVSGNKVFSFENTGNITVPGGLNLSSDIKFADDTVQTTAWTNSIDYANVTNTPNIPTSFDRIVNSTKTVSLGTNGTLTLPAPLAQLTDANQLANDTAKIYRATNSTDAEAIQSAWNTWYGHEQVFRLYVQEDESARGSNFPWHGMPSWEAYPLILNWNGVGLPPAASMAPAAKTAQDSYLAYKALVSSIDIVNGNKTISFNNTGLLSLPGKLEFKDTANAKIILKTIDPYGYVVEDSEQDKTWTFDTDGKLTLPAGGDILDSDGNSVLGEGSGPISQLTNGANTVSLDNGGLDLTFTSGEKIKTLFGGGIELYRSGDNTIGIYNSGAEIKTFATGGAKHTWTFDTDGNTTFSNGIVFDGSEGNTFALDSGTISAINLRDDGGRGFYTDTGGVSLRGNGTYGWTFGTDGQLTLPTDGVINSNDSLHVYVFDSNVATLESTYNLKVEELAAAFAADLWTGAGYPAGPTSSQALNLAKVLNPLIPDAWITIANELQDAYDAWQAALNGKHWIFGTDGELTIPGTLDYKIGESFGGGSLAITSEGAVNIFTNSVEGFKLWQFGADGNLQLPVGGEIRFSYGYIDQDTDVNNNALRISGGNGVVIKADEDDKTWTFGNDGSLTFPAGTLADLGGAEFGTGFSLTTDGDQAIIGASNLISLETSGGLGQLHLTQDTETNKGRVEIFFQNGPGVLWIFDEEDSSLTFPDATKQTTAWTGALPAPADGDSVSGHADLVFYNGTWNYTSRVTINPATSMLTLNGNSGTGGITFPDDTVQTTAFTGVAPTATTSSTASSLGYLGMPQNSKSTSYGLVIGDMGKHIYVTATSTVTVPAYTSVDFPIGTTIAVIAGTGATVSIAITTDTMYLAGTGSTGTRTLAAYGMATLVKVAQSTWFISGVGLT